MNVETKELGLMGDSLHRQCLLDLLMTATIPRAVQLCSCFQETYFFLQISAVLKFNIMA